MLQMWNIMFIKYTFKHALNDFMNELYVQAINWLIKYCKWFIDSLHDWLVDWWSIEQLVNWWIVLNDNSIQVMVGFNR